MAIRRTGHVAIRVRDLDAAKRFYGDILGMKLGMEIPGQGLFLRFNNYHHDLAVFKARDGAGPASKNYAGVAHIALVADDFDTVLGMYRRLRERSITGPPKVSILAIRTASKSRFTAKCPSLIGAITAWCGCRWISKANRPLNRLALRKRVR
jgi:catechol 2,3-dioxygenase-like lactoylglutathione lyase family enzyme